MYFASNIFQKVVVVERCSEQMMIHEEKLHGYFQCNVRTSFFDLCESAPKEGEMEEGNYHCLTIPGVTLK